jgi:hypothetical protein
VRTIEPKPVRSKIKRYGTFGDYEVSGWRYADDVSWHVKVWPVGSPRDWQGHIMTSGRWEPNKINEGQRSALSNVIAKWEV